MPNLVQSTFHSGEISPSLHARPDLGRYTSSLDTCKNCIVRGEGGALNRSGTKYITEGKLPLASVIRLIPFSFNNTDTYMLEFGAFHMRVIRNGAVVTAAAGPGITNITQASAALVTEAGHGLANDNLVYIDGVVGMTEINRPNRPYRVEYVTNNTYRLKDDVGYIDSTAFTAYTSGGATNKVYELTTPYSSSDLETLNFTQDANIMTLVHPNHAPRELTRTAHNAWTLTTITFEPAIAAPVGLAVTVAGTGTLHNYKITAVADETYEESLPSTSVNMGESGGTFTWTAVADALQYNVYKEVNGIYGFIASTGVATYTDASNVPLPDDTPPEARNPFNGADDYPSVVTFHEQRIVYAATNNNPETIWTSQVGNPHNLNTSFPAKQSDAITVRVVAQEVNRPYGMVSANDLVVITSGSEFALMSGDNPFVIGNIRRKQQSSYGSREMRALIVGGNILFVAPSGAAIRNLLANEFGTQYAGQDLTSLSRHLFRRKVVQDWTYAELPDSIVWAVQETGELLGMTYLPEHEIVGWHRHDTDGEFRQVASVREGNETAVYVVVKRDSWTYPMVERFAARDFIDTTNLTDAWFVDSGLQYSGAPVTTVTGLEHLEGKEVAILADGNVHPNKTVSGGSVTLDTAASEVIAGLPYDSYIRTLEPPVLEKFGNHKSASRVIIGMEESRGIKVGVSLDQMVEEFPVPTNYDTPLPLITDNIEFTIDPDWQERGRLYVRQTYPLPMQVLSVVPDYEAEPD